MHEGIKDLQLCVIKMKKMTEEDNNFFYFYQMYLALAILSCMGEDDAKKVANIILAQVE